MESKTNAVCPGCTCLCDDIEILDPMVANNACERGRRWFQQPELANGCWVENQPVDFISACGAAKKLIAGSRAPLICGLSGLSTSAQQSVWRLADRIAATIDTTLTNSARGSMFALQRVGRVTATLGEVASRSDLVVFWFCDSVTTHPRHLERYSRPAGGPPRKIIVIDDHSSATAHQADTFIQLSKPAASAAIAVVRGLIAGVPLDSANVMATTGRSIDQWQSLAESLLTARYGAIFYGHTTPESQFDLATDSLASLLRELNQKTRFVGLPLRDDANAQSAENVLAWSSGFPFAINLHRRFPRFHGLEYSAETILARGECDLIILASTLEFYAAFPSTNTPALDHFDGTPKIVLSETGDWTAANTNIKFHVAQTGKNSAGDFCRQDDVALRLPNLKSPETGLSAEQVFQQLH